MVPRSMVGGVPSGGWNGAGPAAGDMVVAFRGDGPGAPDAAVGCARSGGMGWPGCAGFWDAPILCPPLFGEYGSGVGSCRLAWAWRQPRMGGTVASLP
ncbi:hypothetical protein [Komagataeibacter swingsii]|uniref:Uncharacterized protein n=1 Tax=Komagataeibacter swingsii TaxID=215220 RepID=A0A850NXC4_9PROT|nr:hypothetical protein [Komagataeibacter swingsii]NVN35834.1 hypothetical protein [Komagataeibacter swingsii]